MLTNRTAIEKSFRYLTFEIQKNKRLFRTYTFILNPEEYSQDEPSRSNVIKTLGGAYVEEWGRDLINVNIKGTTGYKKKHYISGEETDGFQAFKDLRNNIYRYFLEPDGKMKQKQNDIFELLFFNWEDDEFYNVYPERFILMRSKNKPLLYSYDFSFILLHPIIKSSSNLMEAIISLSRVNTYIKRFITNIGVMLHGL